MEFLSLWPGKQIRIGFYQAEKEKDYNELQIIYVLPGYQGRGIGKALAKKALSFFRFEEGHDHRSGRI